MFSLDEAEWPALYARIETVSGYPVLASSDAAHAVVMALLRTVRAFRVEPAAYCVMPDHAQVILAGRDGSDPRAALRRWKQMSGTAYRQRTGRTLWRPRCAEHLLRDPAALWRAVRYLIDEPVRAGVARTADEFPWLGAPRAVAAVAGRRAGAGPPAPRPDWWPARVSSGRRTGYSSPR